MRGLSPGEGMRQMSQRTVSEETASTGAGARRSTAVIALRHRDRAALRPFSLLSARRAGIPWRDHPLYAVDQLRHVEVDNRGPQGIP